MQHSQRMTRHALTLATALLLLSCSTKKAVTDTTPKTTVAQTADEHSGATSKAVPKTVSSAQTAYLRQVTDNAVYAPAISADLTFRLQAAGKDITVPGALRMKRNEVIRLQLFIPLLRSEVGRIEFTPDYVLLVDRIHKEYVRAGYNDLDFLKVNRLDFYSLQALFWNQLMVPGEQTVGERQLADFRVPQPGKVTLTSGNMTYNWLTDPSSGRITQALFRYLSGAGKESVLTWNYAAFRPLGVKWYPANHTVTFVTSAGRTPQTATLTLELDDPETRADWETRTQVSDKYKPMDVKQLFDKILKF